jgi:hypothetical protein
MIADQPTAGFANGDRLFDCPDSLVCYYASAGGLTLLQDEISMIWLHPRLFRDL